MAHSEHRHHTLHPIIHKSLPSNALPSPLRNLIHPTHIIFDRDGEQRDWKSRDHRKHRHLPYSPSPDEGQGRMRKSKNALEGILHMTRLEWWNISWWVAIFFTIGSIVWVLNGFGSFLPFVLPSKYNKDASESFTGWTAFAGATIFEVGSICGVWEAWNRDDEAYFGWGVKESVKYALGRTKAPADQGNEKPSTSSPTSDSQSNLTPAPTYNNAELALETNHGRHPRKRWVWFSLSGKYFRELGFLAAFAQLCGASIFWISGFTAIPQIQSSIMDHTGVLDGVFWTPQVVGGSGFIISSILMMLETQTRWWIPKPQSLGWQVGFWNLIGGIGFTLCGALGYAGEISKTEYQSSLSTFWGSWAFLIGSVLQLYESVNSVA